MPLYFPVIICTVFLSFLSSPDAVIGSVFARAIIRTVVLIFTGRSDMVCAFPSLPVLTYTITLTYSYAWHTSLEHSPPFHLALPAIIITHRYRYQCKYPHRAFSLPDDFLITCTDIIEIPSLRDPLPGETGT